MNYGELTKQLKRLGYAIRRQAKGSHEIWWHPERKVYTIIPRHRSKDIPTGTLRKILKDLDLTSEDLTR